MINTNFCGTTWEDHTKNCGSSRPYPRGDECGATESCFSDSPCVVLANPSLGVGGSTNDDAESNVGSFCGIRWNALLTTVSYLLMKVHDFLCCFHAPVCRVCAIISNTKHGFSCTLTLSVSSANRQPNVQTETSARMASSVTETLCAILQKYPILQQ